MRRCAMQDAYSLEIAKCFRAPCDMTCEDIREVYDDNKVHPMMIRCFATPLFLMRPRDKSKGHQSKSIIPVAQSASQERVLHAGSPSTFSSRCGV